MEAPLEPHEPKVETGWGATIAIGIVVVVVTAGGLYFFYQQKRAHSLDMSGQAFLYAADVLC